MSVILIKDAAKKVKLLCLITKRIFQIMIYYVLCYCWSL